MQLVADHHVDGISGCRIPWSCHLQVVKRNDESMIGEARTCCRRPAQAGQTRQLVGMSTASRTQRVIGGPNRDSAMFMSRSSLAAEEAFGCQREDWEFQFPSDRQL